MLLTDNWLSDCNVQVFGNNQTCYHTRLGQPKYNEIKTVHFAVAIKIRLLLRIYQYKFTMAAGYRCARHGIVAMISPKFSSILHWTSILAGTKSLKFNKKGLKKRLNSCSISFFTNFEHILTNTEAVTQQCFAIRKQTENFR